ncbi:conserved hypothetical protein [Chthoniobacter flavus Ellin428]|uniref:Uncharacterized protein n=1 Tax=Chthoniobacter flavus Ellin428 TaxID=497964 RepID=B4CTL9_9BACT|nr:hypothetical protein [Chthoniobacter flavus]EDY21893.1 conserved hypothetical protein [Chthoniobacter flavus Ellin428]
MKIEKTAFGGWTNCLRIANDHAELVITLDVGPRVISYQHLPAGKNVLKTNADELGKSGEDVYIARGGHRLWLAPENERTYFPDNSPVTHELLPDGVRLENAPAAPWHIKKTLTVTLSEHSPEVKIEHRATNTGTAPATLATWGRHHDGSRRTGNHPTATDGSSHTQHAAGSPGRCCGLTPDTADERWRWGREFITLRQTAHSSPTKLGLQHRMKWIGYFTRSTLFVKLVEFDESATYPDYGCNFETFSNATGLQIETLSPLRTLAPGESVGHSESWHLFGNIPEPHSLKEDALSDWIQPFLGRLGLH